VVLEVRAGVAQAMALLVCTGAATGVVFCFCLRTCYCSVLQKLRFCVVGKMRLPGGIVSMGSRVKIRPFGGARRLISMEAIENPL
jgi:hypothetical protein